MLVSERRDYLPLMGTEFNPDQFSHIYPDGIERHWWHIARSAIVARELTRLCPGRPVLDIGCGRGVTLSHLRRRGIEAYGVEPADVAPVSGTGAWIYRGARAEDLDRAERDRFSVVTLLDVIEHLSDPVEFLEAVASRYANLEHVIVTVPACPELWTNYDEYNGHFRRYEPAMIEELAHSLDWTLVRQRFFFRSLYFPIRVVARRTGRRSTRIRAPDGLAVAAHRALARLLLMEYRLPLGSLPGSSIIASFHTSTLRPAP
ncbi:MAG: class I SAM-dependent methyltransferase [Candidatus Palauibacterales bacterium]|nr:class I SAM-dependent methyltransferase [Candidatus Palauibacterales bacterium]